MARRLVVTCMDRRLVEKMKTYDNSETIIVCNAGANVYGLRGTIASLINENKFSEIFVFTHDHCGAMKIVSDHLFYGKRATADVYVHLVKQFDHGRVETPEDLDAVNLKIQDERIHALAPGIKVHSEMLKMSTLGIPPALMEHRYNTQLVVSNPVAGGYSPMFDGSEKYMTYAIVGQGDEIMDDIEIAVSQLDVVEITFLIQQETERRKMERFRDRVKMTLRRWESSLGRKIGTEVKNVKRDIADAGAKAKSVVSK
jgi:carbonic anhydrase